MAEERVRAVVVEFVRGVDGVSGQVSGAASFDELGVDSMSTMDLLDKVEREFGVAIPDEALPLIVTIQDLVDFVVSAKQKQGVNP
ncbi:acyl carrier protein [Actinocrispum wychmicini]|uniref:Acyl carrier protein n=1 Tax=Actinocrispum wychmicini TaxID=1213861 RepID=A0A4R2JMW8_9PSEU|nr:acyl carrier protein [Actinocrispum wychmicini]TCO60644.1 acyl carrier protein [Actinocrispum wychmicini]